MTSRDAVNVVQRRLRGLRTDDGAKVKVGHAGTLDPLAEGVLVMGVGRAVRLVPYVQQQVKHYRGKFLLGQSSVSGDLEGEVAQHPDLPIPTLDQLQTAATGLIGTITQTPPAHSAIWIDGVRAHERVRAGEDVDMPSRQVQIDTLQILKYQFPEIELDIQCGSGTYIRTLGMDLARAAGSVAVMSHLCRHGVGRFVHTKAVSVQRLAEDDLEPLLLPPIMAVAHMPQIEIDEDESVRLGHGLQIRRTTDDDEAAAINEDGELRAIVNVRDGAWFPKRVFPTQNS
ncbi:tRNA pseudouridine synthase B [Rubripirellula lacrimiformis]|uniref:tRNA pseudouridine synthase B n=2 Tax=Rubripirellula lacrimiformis TaxID=1930273 RepID=A0A517NHE4_9BACT|nr:tRNA pseudouridine synthase B [Rubripirellula lacrimiformis]